MYGLLALPTEGCGKLECLFWLSLLPLSSVVLSEGGSESVSGVLPRGCLPPNNKPAIESRDTALLLPEELVLLAELSQLQLLSRLSLLLVVTPAGH